MGHDPNLNRGSTCGSSPAPAVVGSLTLAVQATDDESCSETLCTRQVGKEGLRTSLAVETATPHPLWTG